MSTETKITCQAISTLWIRDIEVTRKASTSSKYRDYLGYILPKFGNRAISSIANSDISDFCTDLQANGGKAGQGLSPKTVTEIFGVLKRIRKFAISRGHEVGYTEDCTTIRREKKKPRVLSPEEQNRLLNCLLHKRTIHGLGILLCLLTGIRLGELCALRWDDISLKERMLNISKTRQRVRVPDGKKKTTVVTTSPKSECSKRMIPLPKWFCQRIQKFYKPGAYILTGRNGKPIDPRTMQNKFKAALKAANIEDANFHALRHTFATNCVEKNMDAECLSELLGHSSVVITLDRYVHPSMSIKRSFMEKVSADIGKMIERAWKPKDVA